MENTCKFKVGDVVKFNPNVMSHQLTIGMYPGFFGNSTLSNQENRFVVSKIYSFDPKGEYTEYCLENYPHLVWESDLEKYEE